MATFQEKLKHLGASLKRPVKAIIDIIAKKTPDAAETLTEKTKVMVSEAAERAPKAADKAKEIVSTVADKAQEALTQTKLRLKLYNLNKGSEKRLGELGGIVFELLSRDNTDIYEDSNVKEIIEAIKHIKKEIRETEKEIEGLGSEGEEETE